MHEKDNNSNINIIFQYNKYNEVKLYRAKIKMIENYFYFEKNDMPIATGIINVNKKLNQIKNSKIDFENSFYILNAPISPQINFKLLEDISDKIEIIYLSGKYLKDLEYGKNKQLEALIKFTDNFIYVEKEEDISDNSFQYLKKIIFFISTINNSFNLNKFLYIINGCGNNYENIEKKVNEIKTFLPKVSWLSIEDYKKYLEVQNMMKNDKMFFTQIIEKIKQNKSNNSQKNFDLINEIKNEIEKINKSLLNVKDKLNTYILGLFFNYMKDYILAKDIIIEKNLKEILLKEGLSEEDLNKNRDNINKFALQFSFLKNGINSHISFYNSNIEIFLLELFNLIFEIKFYLDYDLKIITENTKDYLKSMFKLINEKISEIDEQNQKYFFISKIENNDKKKIYDNFEIY